MKILVDTSVWSLALRKKSLTNEESKIVKELKELIHEERVVLIGPIRQELLSGISDKIKFEMLKEKMRAFEDMEILSSDYENAAEIHNECRRNGIQGSHIDYLICSAAKNNDLRVFTTDKDFTNYIKFTGIKLHTIREDM